MLQRTFSDLFAALSLTNATNAAPAGYANLSIYELNQTLNSLLDQIKYEVNNQILADTLSQYINSCQSILELLDKKLYALIGTKQTHTTARQEIFERIKSKIAALLKINEPEKITETRAAQIKKMISEIMNACQVLSQHMQQDIEKINFFPPMEKSALIALIRDIDAKTYYFDIPELPIALLKKYLKSEEFIKTAPEAIINTKLFLAGLNKEEKAKLYYYYSENAALPVEDQAEVFKYLMRGMSEADYERTQVTKKNRDKLTSYLPAEMWDQTLQFLNENDLRRVKCSATFFKDLVNNVQLNKKINKDYSLPVKEMSTSPIIEVDSNCPLIVTAINENLLAVADGSRVNILKLNAAEEQPVNLSSIIIPDLQGIPAEINQLAVAKNRKMLAVFLSFNESYYINIYDLLTNNKFKLRKMMSVRNRCVGLPSFTHDGQMLIYCRRVKTGFFHRKENVELVFYDLEQNCELTPKDKLKAYCVDHLNVPLITPNKKVISIHHSDNSYNYYLRVWDEHAQCIQNINTLCTSIKHVSLFSNNTVGLCHSNTMDVFDLTNGEMVNKIECDAFSKYQIEKTLLLPDSKIALAFSCSLTHYQLGNNREKKLLGNEKYIVLYIISLTTKKTIIAIDKLPLSHVHDMVLAENGNMIVIGEKQARECKQQWMAITCKFAELKYTDKNNNENQADKVETVTLTPK